jgi:hypothetical protein
VKVKPFEGVGNMTDYEQRQALRRAWLGSLKVGDEAAMTRDYRRYTLGRVVRVTPSQILVKWSGQFGEGSRYRKSDGELVGASTYEGSSLCAVTDSIREAVRVREARVTLGQFNFNALSDAAVLRVLEVLQAERRGAQEDAQKEGGSSVRA